MDLTNQLEPRIEVAVYTKRSNGFYINTPVGHYNLEWAVVFHEGSGIKHIYFVVETKGYDKDSLKDYRRAESLKIECASRHFATIPLQKTLGKYTKKPPTNCMNLRGSFFYRYRGGSSKSLSGVSTLQLSGVRFHIILHYLRIIFQRSLKPFSIL